MEYNRLVSVTGLGGLYELMSSKADGGIVKSLEDKTTKFVSTRLHNFSHLESIEVFTTKDNVNLVEVFTAMKNSAEPLPEAKADAKAIREYFEKVYPTMDFDRVYTSDMKKMVKWFYLLKNSGIEIKLSEEPVQDEEDNNEELPQEPAIEEPQAKPAVEEQETPKAKAAKPKKVAATDAEEAEAVTETKAAKKKSTKK